MNEKREAEGAQNYLNPPTYEASYKTNTTESEQPPPYVLPMPIRLPPPDLNGNMKRFLYSVFEIPLFYHFFKAAERGQANPNPNASNVNATTGNWGDFSSLTGKEVRLKFIRKV